MLKVQRNESSDQYMTGKLYDNEGNFICYTLEPDKNRAQHPAIPAGIYKYSFYINGHIYGWMKQSLINHAASTEDSQIAQQFLKHGVPLLQNVPGRKAIEIHIGNSAFASEGKPFGDTEGCLLLGLVDNGNGTISYSTAAYYKAYPIILNDNEIQYLDA